MSLRTWGWDELQEPELTTGSDPTETGTAATTSTAPCLVVLSADAEVERALLDVLALLLPGALVLDRANELVDRVDGAVLACIGAVPGVGGIRGALGVVPPPDAVVTASPGLDDLVAEGRRVLSAHRAARLQPILWGGHHLAHTLGFWRSVLGTARPLLAVLAATPLAVVAGRDPTPGGPGADADRALLELACHERWVRAALRSLEGVPTFVMGTHHLGPDIPSQLSGFLATHGLAPGGRATLPTPPPPAPPPPAARPPAGQVNTARPPAGLLTPEMVTLDEQVMALVGAHRDLHAPLGPESRWTAALLDQARALAQALAGLRWTSQQLEPLLRVDVPARPSEPGPEGRPAEYPLNASADVPAYHRWLEHHGAPTSIGGRGDPPTRRPRTAPPPSRDQVAISVVVPVYRAPLWALERCVGSVLDQDFAAWELVLCDDCSDDPALTAYLGALPAADPRIHVTALERNGGISVATNAALALATGTFVAFLDHDDELAAGALSTMAAAIAAHPEADFLYSDEDKVDERGSRYDPFFKPEWSPDLLLGNAYTCHLTVVRRQLVADVGGLRPAFDGSQDWDLALRATERARAIVHVPELLYHWRALPASAASGTAAKPWAYEAGRRVLVDTLARRGEQGEVTQVEQFPGRYRVRRAIRGAPVVSVVVPFRDRPAMLASCVESVCRSPGYDRIELVLVDNSSALPETAALLDQLSARPDVVVVDAPGPFNWSLLNNLAAQRARGDVLLFLNNDTDHHVDGWLGALLAQAQRPEVGAVGARLLYPDRTVQHAGVVIGLGGSVGHVLSGLSAEDAGYGSMAIQARDCSAITGACLMTRRATFEAVGGFDQELALAYNDVDYCLRVRAHGLLVVYEPLAEMVHHELKSRAHTDDSADARRLLERWGPVIAAGDPYLSASLSHWRRWCPLATPEEEEAWKRFQETHRSTPSTSSST